MRTAVVLFTRDLRAQDNVALATAVESAEVVVPLFVLDDAVLDRFGAPNRVAFLLESIHDLDASLSARGCRLVVRRGETVAELVAVVREAGAGLVVVAEDVSAFARAREARLRRAASSERFVLDVTPGVTVVPPGELVPSGGGGGGAYRVFTAYWRRWRDVPLREPTRAPDALTDHGIDPGHIPAPEETAVASATLIPRGAGGESTGRRRLERWLDSGLASYERCRDDLAAEATSGLSPYLHLGCLSAAEVAWRAAPRRGAHAFLRQLCWRDFHHQLLAARPSLAGEDMRPRGDRWRDDDTALAAWQEGQTGYPLVDAGMRQLLTEGTMHNRARLVTASFLTKHLYLDWRLGASHFARHLVDGDVANNTGNWQWVAGTGADSRPNRVFNPTRQAIRFDRHGDYVRRYVPELEALRGAAVHEPWAAGARRPRDYPLPIVDHRVAVERFRRARAA